jgi:aspartate aminotransferase-like enzyme
MAKPVFHHRTKEYQELFRQVTEGLQYVFQTQNDVITLCASGTGAMEAAVVNALAPGEKAVAVIGGKFGERWAELCKANRCEVIALDIEWGKAVQPAQIEDCLRSDPKIAAVFITLCETSTGVATDVEAIGNVVRNYDALLVVDGISGVGALPMKTDEWHVDMLVVGSQKALMMPPGLSFITVSPKAWDKIARTATHAYYFNLSKAKEALADFDTPYTPAVTFVRGLKTSLDMIRAEGIENVWRRHAVMAEAARAAVKAMGLAGFASAPSDAVTTVKLPPGIDGNAVPKKLLNEHGVTIVGGQEKLKGKIVRIAHMGYMDKFDIIVAIAALEMVLKNLGARITLGAGVAAAEEVFFKNNA